jgi:hypothetical protein
MNHHTKYYICFNQKHRLSLFPNTIIIILCCLILRLIMMEKCLRNRLVCYFRITKPKAKLADLLLFVHLLHKFYSSDGNSKKQTFWFTILFILEIFFSETTGPRPQCLPSEDENNDHAT